MADELDNTARPLPPAAAELKPFEVRCPYCERPLRRVSGAPFTRGRFECERCGPFLDFGQPPARVVQP